MKQLVILVIFFLAQKVSFGQTITPQVESVAGGVFSNPQGSLSWTLGEPMTETYQQSNHYLTQGFHQPSIIIVTDILEKPEMDMTLYPNPVRDFLTVKISQAGDYEIDLYDLKGIRLLNSKIHVGTKPEEQQVDMQDYAIALYILRITDVATTTTYSYRIEKVTKE